MRSVVPLSISYFGVPDWSDVPTLQVTIRDYVERYAGSTGSTLDLGVLDIELNDALATLVSIITELGFDPQTVPDISLTPIPSC